jgi:hypothetical protein
MRIECRHIAELPFNLNLPEGLFDVHLGKLNVRLYVSQNRFAAYLDANDDSNFLLASKQQLAAGVLGEHPVFGRRLRTVVEISDELEVPPDEAHVPTQEELINEISGRLIIQRTGLSGDELVRQARAKLASQSRQETQQLTQFLARKLTATHRVPSRVPDFQSALNTLLRLYMARFDDFFVEEVSFHQLGGTITSGITIVWIVNGEVVRQIAHTEKIPPLMRHILFRLP